MLCWLCSWIEREKRRAVKIFIGFWLILINLIWQMGFLNVNRVSIYTLKVVTVLSGMLVNVYCALRLVCRWICLPPPHLCPQPFSPRGCSRLGRDRRAPRPCTMTAPRTKTRTTASTTPRWTGESSCATPGTWNRLSGQLRSAALQIFGVSLFKTHPFALWRSQIKSQRPVMNKSHSESTEEKIEKGTCNSV